MRKKNVFFNLLFAVLMVTALVLVGCSGDDGKNGIDGADGANGTDGTDGSDGTNLIAEIEPESCATCHNGAGLEHQAVYDAYSDTSSFVVTIDSVASVADGAGAFNVTMMFTIMKDSLPYIDADGLPSLDQKRFYAVTYDAATRMFTNDYRFRNDAVAMGDGHYSMSGTGVPFAPESSNAAVYIYVADNAIHVEQPAGSHVHLYSDVYNVGMGFGTLAADSPVKYVSAANVKGCENCHGAPYAKHGYRAAEVPGLPTFAACKTCHYDDRNGGHEDWQIFVDNPVRYAELHEGADITADEEVQYAYTANIMNDTHMSHIMEFPYPQSGSTCNTCHEGKLDMILTDEFMTLTTCKSCHPMTGSETYGTAELALKTIIPHALDLAEGVCNACHKTGGMAPVFSEIHNGYDKVIYADSAGTRYSDIFTVSVDSGTFAENILTVAFSATKNTNISTYTVADIVPTIMIGLYGYDTKDYIVGPHERDADRNRLLEFAIDGETVNPRFTVVSAEGGSWEIQANLTEWADMIASGVVKRAEIAVMPDITLVIGEVDYRGGPEDDDITYALNAPSRTFDLVSSGFDDGYFNPIANVEGCNVCHDALATTFHSGNRGGNITVCRMCHITKSGGSHLEMASRSIDSYVHAIHSFQAFDIGDVNFADPVEKTRYEVHINHTYPLFSITACESCHFEGTYEVPDQSKSLAGIFSDSDEGVDRNIGYVPSYISGPGSRACGACHRADMINADEAGKLISFNQHTKDNGYLVEDEDGLLMDVIETIASFFD